MKKFLTCIIALFIAGNLFAVTEYETDTCYIYNTIYTLKNSINGNEFSSMTSDGFKGTKFKVAYYPNNTTFTFKPGFFFDFFADVTTPSLLSLPVHGGQQFFDIHSDVSITVGPTLRIRMNKISTLSLNAGVKLAEVSFTGIPVLPSQDRMQSMIMGIGYDLSASMSLWILHFRSRKLGINLGVDYSYLFAGNAVSSTILYSYNPEITIRESSSAQLVGSSSFRLYFGFNLNIGDL